MFTHNVPEGQYSGQYKTCRIREADEGRLHGGEDGGAEYLEAEAPDCLGTSARADTGGLQHPVQEREQAGHQNRESVSDKQGGAIKGREQPMRKVSGRIAESDKGTGSPEKADDIVQQKTKVMSNRNLSLEALKSHLFETLEGVKNLSDGTASENEKVSIEQAKSIVDISGKIIDIYKLQVDAVKTFAGVDELVSPRNMATDLGLIEESAMNNIAGIKGNDNETDNP